MAATDAMKFMPWIQWLDLDTELGDDGSMRSSLRRPKPEHINHNGHVNAAVAYGVAEVAGAGAAVMAAGAAGTGAYTVIRSGAIEYRRPACGGITATSRVDPAVAADVQRTLQAGEGCDIDVDVQRTLQAGEGCDIDVDVSLNDADDTVVGVCKFVVSLRPRRPDR